MNEQVLTLSDAMRKVLNHTNAEMGIVLNDEQTTIRSIRFRHRNGNLSIEKQLFIVKKFGFKEIEEFRFIKLNN